MADVQTNLQRLRTDGFYGDDHRIRPELFDQVARDLGKAFAQRGHANVSSSQLRNFYSEVKALEMRLQEMSREVSSGTSDEGVDISPVVFQRNEYLVRMIAPKIAYVQGKSTGGKVSKEFRDFIETSLSNVHNERDFKVFMRLFESVVGFFYGFSEGKN